jgi:hypothetical protein
VIVQIVAHDPFPPEISLSQYGLGAAGWLFSLWVLVLASSPLLLLRYRPVPGPARWLLAMGFAGSLVMAVVRTDEGVQQMSGHAMVHMGGAVTALVFLPLGILFVLRYARNPWPAVGVAVVAVGTIVGILVLLSAAGFDTAGVGTARSWALWQGILVVIEMMLVGLYAAVVSTIDPRRGRAGRSAPVQSAIR